MSFSRTLLVLGCLWGSLSIGAGPVATAAEKPGRIVAGIASADSLLSDLEYIISTLAGQKEQWNKNVYPNLEVFLIGVSTDRPVRMDTAIDSENGKRSIFVIPVEKANLTEFRDDNIAPIDIASERVPGDQTLYELTGGVLDPDSWWMRHAADYAIISKIKGDTAKDQEDPAKAHEGLFDTDKHYDLVVQLLTKADERDGRVKAVEKLRTESDASLKEPKDGESEAALKLRKVMARQQLDTFEQLFSQTQKMFLGWCTDSEAGRAFADIQIQALEGTELQKVGENLGTTVSHFAAIPEAKDPVLKARFNILLAKSVQKRLADFADAAGPAGRERIEKNEKRTPEQKEAGKAVYTVLIDLLAKNADLEALDAFAEVTKQESGKHVLVAGLKAKEGALLKTLAEKLPAANSQWTSMVSGEKIGDIDVHHLVNSKTTDVVKTFWGTGDMYIAAGPDTIWLAKGEGSLDVLKTYIEKGKGKAEEGDKTRIASVRFHAKPILTINDSFWEEIDFDVKKIVGQFGFLGGGDEKKSKPKTTRPGHKAGESKSTRDQLKNFKWAEAAMDSMTEGADDVVEVNFYRKEKSVDGLIDIRKDVLKAAGTVIAKFAKENLQ